MFCAFCTASDSDDVGGRVASGVVVRGFVLEPDGGNMRGITGEGEDLRDCCSARETGGLEVGIDGGAAEGLSRRCPVGWHWL